MKHLEVMKLLNSLATTKQLLNDLEEFDDYDMVELLELKYERMFRITSNPSNNVQHTN